MKVEKELQKYLIEQSQRMHHDIEVGLSLSDLEIDEKAIEWIVKTLIAMGWRK